MKKVVYEKKALKGLRRIPQKVAQRFRQSFLDIADQKSGSHDIKKLTGREGYRLRIGGYRGIYETAEGKIRVIVLNIGSRGDIYK